MYQTLSLYPSPGCILQSLPWAAQSCELQLVSPTVSGTWHRAGVTAPACLLGTYITQLCAPPYGQKIVAAILDHNIRPVQAPAGSGCTADRTVTLLDCHGRHVWKYGFDYPLSQGKVHVRFEKNLLDIKLIR